jgi:D-3-phosphoglycerate dehydrogenase
VVITFRSLLETPGKHMAMLAEAGCEVVAPGNSRALTAAELIPLLRDADGIIAGVDDLNAEVLASAPRLKAISRFGVGFDSVDLTAATREGIVVTTTPGCNHVSVAELALGLIFSLARRLPQMNVATHAGEWPIYRGVELWGKTLGVVGMGRIGKAISTRAKGLEMEVVAYDVIPDPAFAREHGIALVSLDDLLRRSDFVTLHCPATPGAPPLIGEEQLRLMKPGAFLINTARGTLVDEEALYRALVEGRLAGAGLDVFHKEPPGPNPLLTLDNVVATPHIGGTRDSGVRSSKMAVENLLAVLRGERCPNAINPEVYERPNLRSKA